MEDRIFSFEDLASFDGKDGRSAYVAYRGKVYDVTESIMWEDGEHEEEHQAGVDLTREMEDFAPHGEDLLDGFPVVGTLAE